MRRSLVLALGLAGAGCIVGGCGRRPERNNASSTDAASVAAADAAPTAPRTGEEIYTQYCAVCHMEDGSGVPNFQPALVGNPIVAGDPAKLEAVIRAGSAALSDREPAFAAEMPPFGNLSDEEVDAVVAYTRSRFGPGEGNATN